MKLVALNGSLRSGSSNAALLRAAVRVAPPGVEVVLYDGMGSLPHFNPDLDGEGDVPPPQVGALRALLAGSDGILISSPEYAHGVPGSFKNLLDWLVSDGALVDKPAALFNASPSGSRYAHESIAETLRTMNWRLIDDASLITPFVRRKIHGELDDEEALATLRAALAKFVEAIGG